MRIDLTTRAGAVAGRGSAGRAAPTGAAFQIEDGAPARQARATAQVGGTTSLDALLALQAAEDPLQKRRKLMRRGSALLDALDAIKTDLLAGRLSDGRLNQLMALIGQARERDEPDLDELLDDIELRARVELAKRGLYPAL